jgi:hypothetical protein
MSPIRTPTIARVTLLALFATASLAAQNGPLTVARRGTGELLAGPHRAQLTEAAVDLAPDGGAEIELRARNGETFRLVGSWSAARGEQRMLKITDVAGDANADGTGWVMSERGRLRRIEIGGRAYGGRKLDVSFEATGADAEIPERWRDYRGAGAGWGELVHGARRAGVERVAVELHGRGEARITLDGRRPVVVDGRWQSREVGVVAVAIDALDGRPATGTARIERRGDAVERLVLEGSSIGARFELDFRAGARSPQWSRPQPPVDPAGPGRAAFTEEFGFDQPGDDLRRVRAEDLGACQQLCAEEWRCRAYTFNTRDRLCYLKGSERPLERRSDCITGVKREVEHGLSERPGYNLEGNDYTSVFLRSLEECQQACHGDRICLAYTYNTRSRMCYLKDRVGTYRPRSDVVSGEKALHR